MKNTNILETNRASKIYDSNLTLDLHEFAEVLFLMSKPCKHPLFGAKVNPFCSLYTTKSSHY